MKVAIVGSRTFKDYQLFLKHINKLVKPSESLEIISGGAEGTDSMAELYARNNNVKFTKIKPDYKKYGKSAPLIRNKEIVNQSDRVIVFWDGISWGSKFVIDCCEGVNKECQVIKI